MSIIAWTVRRQFQAAAAVEVNHAKGRRGAKFLYKKCWPQSVPGI